MLILLLCFFISFKNCIQFYTILYNCLISVMLILFIALSILFSLECIRNKILLCIAQNKQKKWPSIFFISYCRCNNILYICDAEGFESTPYENANKEKNVENEWTDSKTCGVGRQEADMYIFTTFGDTSSIAILLCSR